MAKYKVKTRDCQLIVGVRLSLKEKINVTQLDFFSNRYIRGLLKVKMIKKSHIEYYGPIGISLYERLKKPMMIWGDALAEQMQRVQRQVFSIIIWGK